MFLFPPPLIFCGKNLENAEFLAPRTNITNKSRGKRFNDIFLLVIFERLSLPHTHVSRLLFEAYPHFRVHLQRLTPTLTGPLKKLTPTFRSPPTVATMTWLTVVEYVSQMTTDMFHLS